MLEETNLWSNGPRVIEIGINALLFYAFIVAMVRLVGKRTTSELNNFDWIINVAVGSLAASGIMLEDVATIDAVVAIGGLALCQYLTTWWVRQTDLGSKVVTAHPTLLTHKGEYLWDAMKDARVSQEEIRAALRSAGLTANVEANWVVLETNGQLTVIPRQDADLQSEALEDVRIPHKPED